MAGRANKNLPGGSLKYQFVYFKIRICRCSWTPPTNGRGVFVVFLSFCIGFYSILSVSRCAPGSFFYLVFSFFGVFLMWRC